MPQSEAVHAHTTVVFVPEMKGKFDAESFVKRPIDYDHLNAINGTQAVGIRANQLVFFSTYFFFQGDTHKFLVFAIKLEPCLGR